MIKNAKKAFEHYCDVLDLDYKAKEQEIEDYEFKMKKCYQEAQAQYITDLEQTKADLKLMQATRAAAMQAKMKEKEIELIEYTKTQDFLNCITHAAGAAAGALVLIACTVKTTRIGSPRMIVSAVIYGQGHCHRGPSGQDQRPHCHPAGAERHPEAGRYPHRRHCRTVCARHTV